MKPTDNEIQEFSRQLKKLAKRIQKKPNTAILLAWGEVDTEKSVAGESMYMKDMFAGVGGAFPDHGPAVETFLENTRMIVFEGHDAWHQMKGVER